LGLGQLNSTWVQLTHFVLNSGQLGLIRLKSTKLDLG